MLATGGRRGNDGEARKVVGEESRRKSVQGGRIAYNKRFAIYGGSAAGKGTAAWEREWNWTSTKYKSFCRTGTRFC
jgi:hypothetical protein